MSQRELAVVDGEEVFLDPANLKFTEATLSEYLKKEGGWYNYFGAYLALAEREYAEKESYYDNLYNLRFYQFKSEEGGSDKLCEARAKIDKDVQQADKELRHAKYTVSLLKNHLRAWDKNHDNAQSMGHTLRREMDRLGNDIRGGGHTFGVYEDIDAIVQPFDAESES